MLKIVSSNLWEMIREKAKHAEHRRAAIAYVTDPTLLPLRRGDLLITDASDASIASGRTAAIALEKYFKAGVELFCLSNLHAKVLVLDDWAVVGSANASQHSAEIYVEAAIVTDRPELVGQADKLVTSLSKDSSPIDDAFVSRILKIPVKKSWDVPPVGLRRKQVRSTPATEQKFWLASLRGEAEYPGNEETVEEVSETIQKKVSSKSGVVDWFWWGGSTRFPTLAKEGDVVIECWRPRAKVATSRSVRVYRHGRIAKVFQEPGVKVKTFHCVWPADHHESAVSWSAFLALAKRAGISRKLSYTGTIELTAQQSAALFEIWPHE